MLAELDVIVTESGGPLNGNDHWPGSIYSRAHLYDHRLGS